MYKLPDLPYSYDALEPIISKEIMELHHAKHHNAYVTGANLALEKLAKVRAGEMDTSVKYLMKDLSFNLNGHILHSMFWQSMRKPQSGNLPSKSFTSRIDDSFGNYSAFVKEMSDAAKTVEGSGWAILVTDFSGKLLVHQVEKQNYYHLSGFKPLMGIDVWEHAYYLDYKNDRGTYVDKFWDLVNWDFIESTYSNALKCKGDCNCGDGSYCNC